MLGATALGAVNVHVTGLEPALEAVTVTVAPGIRFETSTVGVSSAVTPSPSTPVSDAEARVTSGAATTNQVEVRLRALPATSVAVTTSEFPPDGSDVYDA